MEPLLPKFLDPMITRIYYGFLEISLKKLRPINQWLPEMSRQKFF
jgi:hypothetical protein